MKAIFAIFAILSLSISAIYAQDDYAYLERDRKRLEAIKYYHREHGYERVHKTYYPAVRRFEEYISTGKYRYIGQKRELFNNYECDENVVIHDDRLVPDEKREEKCLRSGVIYKNIAEILGKKRLLFV